MLELALMIEGQDGLTWERWARLARAAEELGFVGLYRSDHFTNANPPDKDSLELWVSLTWLASHTSRIEFGPLVSPVSFRDPVFTARIAAQVDDLSGGRLTLGVGAGWQEREHHLFGYDLMDVGGRFARFEEGLQVITALLNEERASFSGDYYTLRDAGLLPRPSRPGGPPILIGGNGPRRTLPLVAQYAGEWNAVLIPADRFAELNTTLDELLEARGRAPGSVRRSLMTNIQFGRDEAEFRALPASSKMTPSEMGERGIIHGTPGMVIEQLGALAEAGVQRVMLQWMEQDNIDKLEAFAASVLPQVQG
ncbi:MAG: TIGR03560 family F420-dependent LLM class oxidoreductase [Anaerolineae bacterium]|nr:TIGR03560 family F420-dependent LLM class oxidoreductase [Anaerolineae bacterium]